MSILSRLGSWRLDDGVSLDATAAVALLGGGGDVAQVRDLPPSVAQAFGLSTGERISRADAMRIPTVRRARQVVCGTIGAQPLVAHRAGADVTSQRPLLVQPNPNTTLQYELTWTADDLFFHGVSWWLVTGRDAAGFPSTAERVAPSRVRIDWQLQRVYVDGVYIADRDLVRFDGPDEGLLAYGGDTLHTSRLLDAAVRRLASGDLPLAALKLQAGAEELSAEPDSAGDGSGRSQVEALLDSWDEARLTRTTAYLNGAVDLQTFQKDAREQQLAEGRQQQRIDEANVCNVPPRVVNAPSAQPMTYSNALAERADLVDTSLSGYVVAVEQTLSLGHVTPRGTTVRLDLSRYLAGDTLSGLQAAQLAQQLGASVPSETRADVLGRPPLTPEQQAELAALHTAADPTESESA